MYIDRTEADWTHRAIFRAFSGRLPGQPYHTSKHLLSRCLNVQLPYNWMNAVWVNIPSMCLLVCEDSSQRPGWTALMLPVVAEPLTSPTVDILWSRCCSTWPFMCTENTSCSELMPTRCRLTVLWAQMSTSGEKCLLFIHMGACLSVCVFLCMY